MSPEPTGVVLAGMKHTGKSTLAHLLARKWRLQFFDLDEQIEREYRPDRAVSCREIYRVHGASHFQGLERAAASRVAASLREREAVVALGGGIADNESALQALAAGNLVVYLSECWELLYERIMARGRPAFLSEESPRRDFERIYNRRDPVYRRYADIVVDLHGLDINRSFALMLDMLTEKGYAR